MKQIFKEYDRMFLLEPTKLRSIVDALHRTVAGSPKPTRDEFEVGYAGNRRDRVTTLDELLALQNRKAQRIESLIITCSSTPSALGPDHSIQAAFFVPRQPGGDPNASTRNPKVVSITVRGDDTAWSARSLAEVEEQVERTFESHTFPALVFIAILAAALALLLSRAHLAPAPEDLSRTMWLRAADVDRVERVLGEDHILTSDEMREVSSMQLRNLVADRKAFQSWQARQKESPKWLIRFLAPFVLVLGCGVYLFSQCYPRAVFLWGDEVAHHQGLLQQRNWLWSVIVGITVIGVFGNLVTMALTS